MVEEEKSGGRLRGCFLWVASMVGIGLVALVVLFSLDVVSPREKPCPLDSPPIPTSAQIASAGDLFRDECVRVSGKLVSRDVDELVMEIDRGDYVQRVSVHVPPGIFDAVSPGVQMSLAGWLRVEKNGTYTVHFCRSMDQTGSGGGTSWRTSRGYSRRLCVRQTLAVTSRYRQMMVRMP